MSWLKWGLIGLLTVIAGLVLHYSLPQHDVVRIVGTDVKRMDLGARTWFWSEPDSMTDRQPNRDVRFINAVGADGDAYVYRNEDTNWSYPPYFKFRSGSLTAEAQALVSTAADPVWTVVTHYGWRIELLTMFPNAVDIRPAEGPREFVFPWFNTIFFAALFALGLWLRGLWLRLRHRHLDPLQDDIEEAVAGVTDTATRTRGAATGLWTRWLRWLDTWKPKHKRRY